MSATLHPYGCVSCGKIRWYSWKAGIPSQCMDCYKAGTSVPHDERITTPWMRDEQGNLSRSVEGGA